MPYLAMHADLPNAGGGLGWLGRLDTERLKRDAPGWLTSALLHGLLLAAVLLVLNAPLPKGQNGLRFVPVTLVPFGGNSASPRAGPNAAPMPAHTPSLPQHEASSVQPSRTGVSKTRTVPDELEAQLRRLSRAAQPQTGGAPAAENFAAAEPGENGEGEGSGGAYGVRDLVRAQVLRRWSLNFAALGTQTFSIPIHVLMRRDGTVLEAEVVKSERYHTDRIYRDIALSARNAVILSSPLVLPAGHYAATFEVTILLNPREALQ